MGLVTLKNLLFGRTQAPARKPVNERAESTCSDDTITEEDLERQPLLGARTASTATMATITSTTSTASESDSRRFRIDARVISDATIGLSDGLTVPFALTAGLSALGQTKVVIFGGMAELIAGAISMGLGGYLGAKSEAASYKETLNECTRLTQDDPNLARAQVREVLEPYDLPKHTLEEVTDHLSTSPRLIDFLMQFHHCEQEPASNRAFVSALTIAAGYLLGGLVPLFPYFFVPSEDVYLALYVSVAVMAVALFAFGYVKTCIVSGWQGFRAVRQAVVGGLEMVVVGGAAAGAAMGLVKAFDQLAQSDDVSALASRIL
ncbi:Vacuolar iron transporter cccA [Colletotrichum siamense]|uniref:Vacuolar iron transporter cccA n=1 Tax=Colletotrichum siamense TaxID=690259 RepID=A0A9P5BNI1_COLSI|nr:Vacuolar iron transporter cccA [Colletotrichum siamense]KAF4845690.1 Vacuolar iron transporter cccA [Colletotrichum siamense]